MNALQFGRALFAGLDTSSFFDTLLAWVVNANTTDAFVDPSRRIDFASGPVLTGPKSLVLLQGHETAAPGVRVFEASTSRDAVVTVTVSDQQGALSASGAGVSRSDDKSLSISGPISQVNAALATLKVTDDVASPGGTFDLIAVTATDSSGLQATKLIDVVAYSLQPVVHVPAASVTLLQGHSGFIPGVRVSEANSVPGETFTVTLSAEEGLLSVSGRTVSGSGSNNLTISGTLAQVNAELATLSETDNVAAPNGIFDLITVKATDGFGNQASAFVSVTAYSLKPVVHVPAAQITLLQGHSAAVAGVSVSEANSLRGEAFTVTLNAVEGQLSASGSGVSGSGSNNLTISGTLAQVNAELATLSETDNVAVPNGIFDLITVKATDGFGNQASANVSLIAYSLQPVVHVPAAQITLLQGHSAVVAGVSVAEANSVPGETFTVTLGAEEGLLSASGVGVSGSGGANLTISGTLAEVNAELATLSETDNVAVPNGIFDLITVKATDGFGNQASAFVNLIAYSLKPVVTVPTALIPLLQGHSAAIAGVSVAEANSVPGETFTVTLNAVEGQLSASGSGVSGSGGANLTISGTLDQVNADLATLSETDNVAVPNGIFDLITVKATDGFGNQASAYVHLIDYSLKPVVTVPTAPISLQQGRSAAIAGVSVAEANSLPDETFTVAVSDQNGQLSASGSGVSGSGSKTLTISGSLDQVNADLATLTDNDNVGSRFGVFDAISVVATDSFGNQASKTISVIDYAVARGVFAGAETLLTNTGPVAGLSALGDASPGDYLASQSLLAASPNAMG